MPVFKRAEAAVKFCVEQEAKRIARNLVFALERNTPKDTTLASISWIAQIGNAVADPVPVGRSTRIERQRNLPNQRARRAFGLTQIEFFRFEDGQISITNGVPYIDALERGHSNQAPNGFVQASCHEAVSGIGILS